MISNRPPATGAKGLRHTIVNGAPTFEGTECTGALPGKLLRSYDMVG